MLDDSAGNVPIQVGVNDNETLGLFPGMPGFSVDELGLTDLVIRGISGKATPINQLLGSASNISLSSGEIQIYFPNSYTATTDASTGWTTINLRETGDGIRLRNPEDPLATPMRQLPVSINAAVCWAQR